MKTKYNGYTCYKCKRKFTGEDEIPTSNMKPGFDQCKECFEETIKLKISNIIRKVLK
jgi:transposase-like protein|tara:strand:- start:580 stop:750 length:171 start_codon:yes stop_codon:yes gene_type:complete